MTELSEGRNYIDGSWTDSASTEEVTVVNPASGEVVAQVPDSDGRDVDLAVTAAGRAFNTWRWLNPAKRAHHLHGVGDAVTAAETPIARAITREMGKPLGEARGEVQKLAKAFHFYAEEATRSTGAIIPNEEDGFTSLVEHEPVGVVAAITPWNYPVELIGWKLAAALAAGCTIVVKPSEYTPTSAIQLWRCLERAGIPAGVANLVHGSKVAGRSLVAHPGINKVAFTGSTDTGAAIVKSISGVKPMSMELGGSCPLIVTDNADLAAAVQGALRRGFRNAGQICIAINRAYVHTSVYPRFVEQLGRAADGLVVADGLTKEDADVGPVANPGILEKVGRHVQDATSRGARLVCGGGPVAGLEQGYFYAPTVLADCTQDMLVMHEETFGPVVAVAPYSELDEAVELANSTPAGLAAYVYTNDLTETFGLGRRLDFGSVAVNNVDAGIMNAPYGGRKGSGYGYEHGREGLDGYLQLKHVRVRHGG